MNLTGDQDWIRAGFNITECYKYQSQSSHSSQSQSWTHNAVNQLNMQLMQSVGKQVQVTIGSSFTSDWMKERLQFFKPIKKCIE